MDDSKEVSLAERYELLKSTCKRQVLINEGLKTEIQSLRKTLQKANCDKTMLVHELLSLKSRLATNFQPVHGGISYPSSIVSNKRQNSENVDSRTSKQLKLASCIENSPSNWNPLDHSASDCPDEKTHLVDRSRMQTSPVGLTLAGSYGLPSTVVTKSRTPLLQNSISSLVYSNDSHSTSLDMPSELYNQGSPPSITSSGLSNTRDGASIANHIQPVKPSRLSSLVTNSVIPSHSPMPVAQNFSRLSFPSQGKSLLSPSRAGIRQISGTFMTKPSTSLLTPKSVILTSPDQTIVNSVQAVQSGTASPMRIACGSTSGQRLLIQPAISNVRSIQLAPTQTQVSNMPDSTEYLGQ